MTDLKRELRRYVEDNFVMGADGIGFSDADSFMGLYILDSTGFLEVITHLEERYGIQVEDEEMIPENLDSLDNLAAFVDTKRRSLKATGRGA